MPIVIIFVSDKTFPDIFSGEVPALSTLDRGIEMKWTTSTEELE